MYVYIYIYIYYIYIYIYVYIYIYHKKLRHKKFTYTAGIKINDKIKEIVKIITLINQSSMKENSLGCQCMVDV